MKYQHQAQQEFQITERLLATFHANCDRCNDQEDLKAIDEEDAASGFYQSGWRVIAIDVDDPITDQLLCKNCFANDRGV